MAIALVQSKEVTASLSFDFSVGNHTISRSIRSGAAITSGNMLLLTVDIRTQKTDSNQVSYPDYMPTSGNYNTTLNSSTWNNLGSNATNGMNSLFTFNNAESGLGDRHTSYAFWTDQLWGSFSKTIDVQFYGPAAGLFYGGKIVISLTEWSGVDSDNISFLSSYTETDIASDFSETETVYVEPDDLILVNHAIDDDSDDDSTVTIAGSSATKIHSTSVTAAGNLPDTLRSESYYLLATSEASSVSISYGASGGTDGVNENKAMYVIKLGMSAVRISATSTGLSAIASAIFVSIIKTANEFKRKMLTGISVNGVSSSGGGMPPPMIRYNTFKEPISSTLFIFNSGMSLPFTGGTDLIAAEFFEGMFYRVYNTTAAKDGLNAFNVSLEWTQDVRPLGENNDDIDDAESSTFNAGWITDGTEVASQAEITGGIHIYYIKDDTRIRGVPGDGPYLLRVKYVLETGHTLAGGDTIKVEFWANAHSVEADSNPYGEQNGAGLSLELPSKRIKIKEDRFA